MDTQYAQDAVNHIDEVGVTPAEGSKYNTWWVGADGNVWTRQGDSIQNQGQFLGETPGDPNGFSSANMSGASQQDLGLTWERVVDPVNPWGSSNDTDFTTNNTGDGGDYADTSQARASTRTSIDSLDDILANRQSEAQQQYQKMLDTYGAEDAQAQDQYEGQVSKNEKSRETNRHQALNAAAEGSRGLHATLASIGALGGTGRQLANRAVASEANSDIGRSDRAFGDNAEQLFNAFSSLKQQQKQRKKDAESTFKKTKQQNRYDITDKRQGLWEDMSSLWARAGNNSRADQALARASSYTPDLVSNTRPQVSEYAKKPLQYQAPALKNYLAGANNMTVDVKGGGNAPSGPINGSLFASNRKRDDELA